MKGESRRNRQRRVQINGHMDRGKDECRQMDRLTVKQMERQKERQTDSWKDRPIGRQIN
jgi:hypothetical protein